MNLKKILLKIQSKADQFGIDEIAKMNSSKISDQISAWSKIGVPATVYELMKLKKKKEKEKEKDKTILTKEASKKTILGDD